MKCDETRPGCLTCRKAGRQCQGYTDNAIKQLCSVERAQDGCRTLHLTRLCLEVLLHGQYESIGWQESPSWLQMLAQVSHHSRTLRSAMALFGSVFEVTYSNADASPLLPALVRRHTAIRAIRNEIDHRQDGFIPAFLASIVLAAGEVLLGDAELALIHLKGAFESLARFLDADGSRQPASKYTTDSTVYGASEATLCTLALCNDMHTACFRLGQPSELPPSFKFDQDQDFAPNLPADGASTLVLLHSCYHFANRASHYKYHNPRRVPPSILQEQSRCIAVLRSCDALQPANSASYDGTKASRQIFMLRAQCLSALIYVSMILNPYEIGYDTYVADFSQLVHSAEDIIAMEPSASAVASLPRFRLEPGLFQPLWLTAIKCRHPRIRRRAVQLLDQIGSEGPWNRRLMTAIARRLICIEEEGSCFPISEAHRIHGCGVYPATVEAVRDGMPGEAEFSQCRDVDDMVRSSDSDDKRHWSTWREDVDLETPLPDPFVELEEIATEPT